MSLIIDGYNLMHAAGIVGHGAGPGFLERSRLAVLNFVVESLEPAALGTTTVVFDARQAPPGLPRERAEALRAAMMATFRDPDFLAEAKQRNLEINNPTSGETLQAQIARVYQMPSRIAQRLRRLAADR